MDQVVRAGSGVWLDEKACSLDDFKAAVEVDTPPETVPLAEDIMARIPIYDGSKVRAAIGDGDRLKAYMAEWNDVFADGPGIVVVRGAYKDLDLIDSVTEVLNALIERERQTSAGTGDHFAAPGANSRLWNAHEKLCMEAPDLFARYNANHVIPLASRAWLGPLYQITTQVNVVRPGGQAQTCHCDYHMGFQSQDRIKDYPARVRRLSAMLTLQGGVAHCDMPVETGPTKLLPYSQTYLGGYLASLLDEFRDYFEEHHAQLPLNKGDAFFFNPAVFHAAGENRTSDIDRIANLMQIGSGYGRSIEIVDRARMSEHMYPVLKDLRNSKVLDAGEVDNVVAACAEGYPFPSNLDIDAPMDAMAPESQQELMLRALNGGWTADRFQDELQQQTGRKRSH